jgi:cytochrome c oxidase subunit 2
MAAINEQRFHSLKDDKGMKKGLARGLVGLAVAAALAWAGTATAQGAAAPVAKVAPAVTAAAAAPAVTAAPNAAEIAATTPGATAATPTAATPALDPAVAGYERMAPTPGVGMPVPQGYNIQQQFTPIGQEAKALLEQILNPLIAAISVFVLGLMGYVMFRYRSSAVATPSTTTHNFTIEVIWTLVPALLLLLIAFPSFRLLANQYDPPEADITVKVTGYQWYWGYEYPDHGGISFDSVMLNEKDAKAGGEPYQLAVDNRLVVPAGKTVKVLVTAADVLHSFAVPSFWVKMDAVPGKVNETWFKVDRPGVYYGQCSELCGTKHGFMPIAIEVLPEEDFRRWVRMKQAEDGIEPTGPGIALASPAPAAAAPVAAAAPAVPPSAPPAAAPAPAA